MAGANPKKAIAAILPRPIDVGFGCEVRPITLGMFALLESIDSPLFREKREGEGVKAIIPTLYCLTHSPADCLAPGLEARAMEWADTVMPQLLPAVREAAERQIKAMTDVLPEFSKKKAAPTAGSPSGSSGPREPTAGTMKRSCGARRRQSSPS